MRKVISSLVGVTLLVLPVIALAQASPEEEVPRDLEICCEQGTLLDTLVDWLFAILLIVAALFIILAAFYFVTAAGDPDKTKKARDFVLYALIGVLVAFAARGLVLFIGKIVGV